MVLFAAAGLGPPIVAAAEAPAAVSESMPAASTALPDSSIAVRPNLPRCILFSLLTPLSFLLGVREGFQLLGHATAPAATAYTGNDVCLISTPVQI
jgi:hypothetical protein